MFCQTAAIPAGRRFVVEYVSGLVVIAQGYFPYDIYAYNSSAPQQYVYFAWQQAPNSLNFGGAFGVGNYHHFGGPVTLYVDHGDTLTLRADGNGVGRISVSFIGYLANHK